MNFNAKCYADGLEDLIDVELYDEERRCFSMLEFDMRRRELESLRGDRPWHRMACESAERLGLVRWEMESRGMEPKLFGYECVDEWSSAEVEDGVLIVA